jgi:nicotinamide-nucleotide amidase
MKAIIISVGDELISGQTIDTNSAHLARRLAGLGIVTSAQWTVGDDRLAIASAIATAAKAADLVIVTGGLGPTADDLTRQALADAMETELVLDAKCLAEIEDFFRRRARTMVPANRIQAMVPAGAEPLSNKVGTAPGIAARLEGKPVFALPGVPHEMECMFEAAVAPRLGRDAGVVLYHTVHAFGGGESDIASAVADLMERGRNPTVGTTVASGMVTLRIISRARTPREAQEGIGNTARDIRSRLGAMVVGEGEETMASVVGDLLRRTGQTLAVAESCTGGMIGEMITTVAGSSDYFLGGMVAYSDGVKTRLLSVPREALDAHGAVSEEVAVAMAQGCKGSLKSDWAIGVTGIAGPSGGSEEKPVGLVYIALAGPSGTESHRHVFPGNRATIRLRASLTALNCLRLALSRQTPRR